MGSDYRHITRWGRLPAWWMFHPHINADRLCLLAALTTYADEQGLCNPSQSTLARHLKRSRPWVNRIIGELVEVGLLEKRNRRRENGGTTSCEYLLRFVPEDAPVMQETGPDRHHDTPCHQRDTNQVVLEQKQNPPADAGARDFQNSLVDEEDNLAQTDGGDDQDRQAPAAATSTEMAVGWQPDRDWQPSPEVQKEARRLFPEASIDSHVALFVSRVRSKGYCLDPRKLDDTWLSWFIEDHRKLRNQPAQVHQSPRPSAPNTSNRMHRYDRFSAWAEAAMS